MMTKKQVNQSISRRRFIQMGAIAAGGLFLEACNVATSTPIPTPTEVVQLPPTNTPFPTSTTTNTPLPPTATSTATTVIGETAVPTDDPTATTEPTATNTNTPMPDPEQLLVADMNLAALRFVESLEAGQREQAVYTFNNEERFRWHWTTPRNFPRNGLPLRDMSAEQKSRATDLLQASLSSMGFKKAINIISLQNDLGNDPELYFITIFGTPGGAEPWGWRWEGHHLSHQFTVVGDQVAMSPFFLGAWPTTTEAGLRAMAQEEDAALELVNSFGDNERSLVLFQDRPITRHVTQNAAEVGPLDPVGILYADMTASQQQLTSEIIQTYIGTLPDHIAASNQARINDAGLEQIRFGWAGSLDRQRPQYFRLQGPTFLLEYDNTRNGGIHIHSVWRDFAQDFGYHLL